MAGHRKSTQLRARSLAALLLTAVALLATGCAGSAGEDPNTAGSASAVPGAVPTVGTAAQGGVVVSGVAVRRSGEKLAVSAKIQNGSSKADQLLTISSQVTSTLTFNPAAALTGKGTLTLGSGGTAAVLTENARLPVGGTVALTFTFRDAGSVQVFSQFS